MLTCLQSACKNVHFHLRALRHIRSSLTDDMATSIAVTLIHSRLNYANTLLYGISSTNIRKLQRCQNTATRFILQQSGILLLLNRGLPQLCHCYGVLT